MKVCNISGSISEVFEIMKLNKVFDIQKDEKAAVEAFSTPAIAKWFGM